MGKVLLVQPNYRVQRETGAWGINPPLGLCYLAAALSQSRISAEILDANALDLTEKEVAKIVREKKPEMVGVSILTPAHEYSMRLVKLLPKSILKVAGGNQATALPDTMLKEGFDVVVFGEGEKTFLEVVKGKRLDDILGIIYKKGNKIVYNKLRPAISDVDSIPYPARYLLPSDGVDLPYRSANTRYFPWTGILTSRGCPYNCYFCFKRTFGYKFRARSVENVLNELIFLKRKYNIKEIDIFDDVFNYDLDRANEILDGIIANKLDIKIRCSNGIRADKVNKRFLRKMKKAGAIYIAYGVESGDEKVLSLIPKGEKVKQIERAVRLTREAGIESSGFFIFGLLGDNKESMEKTLTLSKELPFDYVSYTIATPYPGTRMWEMVKKNGKLFIKNWNDFHHSSGKMMYSYPDTAGKKLVESFYKRAYGEFYFRPKYILEKILSIRNLQQVKVMIHGLLSIIRTRKQVDK